MTDNDIRRLNKLQKQRDELEEFLNLTHGNCGLKFSVTSLKIFPWAHTVYHDVELVGYPELINEILGVIKHHYELVCEALEDA